MLDKVIKINKLLDSQNLYTLKEAKREIPTKSSGFYWIFTKLPLDRFIEAPTPTNPVHVDLSLMAKVHQDSKWVIKQSGEEYWCVYNGKGTDLKARVSAAFTNTDGQTGKLALTRCLNEKDFRVKFVVCDCKNPIYGINNSFSELQRDLERVWRLNFGWPFLSCI
ncbi:hypothetical protein FHG08_06490 [Pseudoalteromonas sp. Scap03]|uniref:hypothetical protein n=1 Tax=unclassified Pseudoalteromonas TaxID=194690 RepID=UPI0015BC495F|nr:MULTISPECIES: hypothetical protein [unclassified Pseudoalteromonas]NWL15378.1 hypothetical protein [Pseudoalteromonas sp. Scap03]QLE80529.1 hypothetical protein FLM54_02755 [Pseudoalteromonas sp. Scap25]QLE88472.1 hypothetical protein FLM47_02755 [Pseudoalteromonas sp. Scap06]